MADILRIFKRDMCGIFRNVLVLIIVIGLCVLPALYAWFNIYSNWDPYSNTGTIPVAVVSEDIPRVMANLWSWVIPLSTI